MKFKTKNYLFIGIPLVVQIFITGVLFVNVGSLEKKVVEESFAKKIVSLSNEEEQMASECLIAMATLRYNNNDTVIRGMNTVFERHKVNKTKLLKMAAQDPANAKVIEEFVDAVDYLLSQVRDFFDAHLESHKGLNFYRTFPESVANFEVLVTMRKASLAEKALRKRFTERATSDRPDTIREQEQLRFFLVCALVVNVVVAFLLATLYGKSTVNRLNQLMNNVHALSEGVVKMSEVKGDDEISDLDEQFRSMAARRLEAEYERTSILQTVTHDLRGPVGTLSIAINILGDIHRDVSEDEVSRRLSLLSRESERLVDLCNAFLDLERIDSHGLSLELEKVNLRFLCESARESVESLTNSTGQEIEIECSPALELNCDKARMMQVLINLLSNAIKYSPDKSTIAITVEDGPDDTVISVVDQGTGISADEAKRLFERFSQLHNATGRTGSGLGLWICKRMVEMHGATISCNSIPGSGTTFSISFPHSQREESSPTHDDSQ